MKPTPLTDEKIKSFLPANGSWVSFAYDIIATRDAQWEQMLAGQPVAAWRCTNWSGNGDDYVYRDADDCAVNAKGEKCGEPLYAAHQTAPVVQEPVWYACDTEGGEFDVSFVTSREEAAELIDCALADDPDLKFEDLVTPLYAAPQPAPVVQEPDLSWLKPDSQAEIREWLADGTFVERACGVMQEQEQEIIRLEKAQPAQPKAEPAKCGACNGSGWVVRDPGIGTDQECFVCDGSGASIDSAQPKAEPINQQLLDALQSAKYAMEYAVDECEPSARHELEIGIFNVKKALK